ncbi:mammalian cell entry protein [Mycolicibacterium sp. HK-90]|uniref:mammalian cell entry protein n=1 Tax=Mycolicibacterium sp. HK-90 TaxID=3056937 RepID=UPI002658838D|nr:mammalian cell entry protein [Mycolicibacterium sp. HK-90]WKG03720.1 mammalian cell entry protein [Mycolicibacterium sp. HK-90]
MEDQPADSGDLTTGEPDKPRRRLRFGRRRRAEDVVEPAKPDEVSETESEDPESGPESDEAEGSPQRRTPMGKRRKVAAEPEGDVDGDVAPEGESTSEGAVEAEAVPEPEAEPAPDAVAGPEAELDADAQAAAGPETELDADAEAEAAEETEAEADGEPAEEQVLVPHRPAGKRLTYAAVAAAAVFVLAGAFGGAMLQPYLADRSLVATKLQVAQTSADAITTLWTYNPDNIESLPDRAERYLSSGFADQYRQLIDSIVPSNKQAQVTNNTEVMGTAVETISRDEATAIVYTNTVSTSPVTKNVPSLRYMSYRVILQRTDGDWRITDMPALTQLDLSPQL